MHIEETPSTGSNPYEAPMAEVASHSSEAYKKTRWFIRFAGVLHLIYGLCFTYYPFCYVCTLFLVLQQKASAPWLWKIPPILYSTYGAALSLLSLAVMYGLFRRKWWAQRVEIAFLAVYFSMMFLNITEAIMTTSLASAAIVFGCCVLAVTPLVWLVVSSTCKAVLSSTIDTSLEEISAESST